MAQQPDQNQEWKKLSPAVTTPKADSLLSARRAERGIQTPAPTAYEVDDTSPMAEQTGADAPSEATPWTAPQAAVAAPEVSASAPEATPASERAEARDVAVDDKPRLLGLRRALIALAVPVLTIMLAVRAVASPAFLWLEYHRPGFPVDSYGFDTQERLRLGSYGLDYILNFAPHTYLADITTGGKAAFLASEVEHMTDVKRVMLISMIFALIMLVLALLSARTLRLRAPGVLRSSLFTGAWLTLALLIGLGVAGAIGWEAFFTTFHEVFFPQGNWQFRMSDTLIRLYPPQFWVDAAATAGALTLLITAAVLAMTWPTRYRKQLALKRRAERQELKELLTK
ncbi:TIGR01906 family membrane protein [Rothia nasimurium]|uniref:TIGR01906 family membrane protein n=1 Tax=Rothia nasimurium TaxID=85336 RepID=UPI002DD65023|nr:TIGR01906 family membrane protein [Rothia nasimurium]